MRKLPLLFVLLLFIISSCIEEYNSAVSQNASFKPELVIQGRIQSGGETIIYLTHTQPLSCEETVDSIFNAKISVVGENGYESSLAEYDIENNCYVIDTRELPANASYSLKVNLDGETYQSEYMNVLESPAIDTLTYKEHNNESFRGISLHVSAHNKNDASRYYLWTYEEDWEFHAPIDIIGIGGGVLVYDKTFYKFSEANIYNHYLYCWKHNTSANIHIYDTSLLDENIVNDVELFRIPNDDIRISYIYSVLVKQLCLDEKAYSYYRTLEKQAEESSGLFTPMPIEIKGNVFCTSNPNINVKGYVLASSVSYKRLFIYESDFKDIHSEYEGDCIILTPDETQPSWPEYWGTLVDKFGAVALTANGNFYPYNNPDYMNNKLYQRECIDCRSVKGSTKKRPDFWPNNHE